MEKLEKYIKNAEDRLYEIFPAETLPQGDVIKAAKYSLSAGGKRIRPVLTQVFCEMCGGDADKALDTACAIEYMHTYSLIHDDLPCMDNDDLRRGKPTNHKVFGEAAAVLAGDGLLTDAFFVLTQSELPAEAKAELVKTLSYRAGPYGMVGGQVLDMEAETRACTRSEVLAIQKRKTGALIRAACEMGVICAGGSSEQRSAAGAYADAVGLAFQIRDDVLDAEGDAAVLGKAVGVDENKNTFLKLYGPDYCKRKVRTLTRQAIAALTGFENADALANLASYLATRDR